MKQLIVKIVEINASYLRDTLIHYKYRQIIPLQYIALII